MFKPLMIVGVALVVLQLCRGWHFKQNFTDAGTDYSNGFELQNGLENLPDDIRDNVIQKSIGASEAVFDDRQFVEPKKRTYTGSLAFTTPDRIRSTDGENVSKNPSHYKHSLKSNNRVTTGVDDVISALKTVAKSLPSADGTFADDDFFLQLKKRIEEDTTIRKNRFLARNTCPAGNSSAPLTLSQSCKLKLTVNEVAEDSRNFDFLNNQLREEWVRQAEKKPYANETKLVLLWNLVPAHEYPAECPACHLITNNSLANPEAVDAIIMFSYRLLQQGPNVVLPTREMFPNAKMIAYEYEPTHRSAPHHLEGLTDYTFGYRRDSDIVKSNGYIQPRDRPFDISAVLAQNAKKTKMAAWMVSNCGALSERLELAKTLQRYGVEVDIYGRCGTLKCPKRKYSCQTMLGQRYKFYFSFESTLCNHYVTEKFYRSLGYNMIPITYGIGHEFTGAPIDSYIDVFDFADVKSLAEYILYLNSNITAYNEYFKWLTHYRVHLRTRHTTKLCELCEKLVNDSPPARTFGKGEYGLWVKEGQCIDVKNDTRIWNFVHGLPQK